MAIHDRYYATPAPDWPSLIHRLQLLSEEHLGVLVRQTQAQEDAAFDGVAEHIG